VVIGHSMGGFVTIATAARHADRLSGVIVCDSPVTQPDPEIGAYHLREAFGRPRTYESVGEAVARFRTVPGQANYLDYVMDHVARQSLKPVDGGYQWKFDRRIFEQFGAGMRSIALPYLDDVTCRLALLKSEHKTAQEFNALAEKPPKSEAAAELAADRELASAPTN
jgi:pimeloyl-ACP methyl ester carboxylesterase